MNSKYLMYIKQSLFITDELYDMERQFNILKEICKVKFFSTDSQKNVLERLNLDMPNGVLVIGPRGCGKTILCSSLSKNLGIKTFIITPELFDLYGDTSKITLLNLAFDILSYENPAILIIKDIDIILGVTSEYPKINDEQNNELANALLLLMTSRKLSESLIIATLSKIETIDVRLRHPRIFDYEIEVPMPSSKVLLSLLNTLMKKDGVSCIDPEELNVMVKTSLHGYTGIDIISVYRKALELSHQSHEKFSISHLKTALKLVKPLSMHGISLEIPEVYWNDIGGQEVIKKKLKDAVEFPIKYRDLFEKHNITQIKGILLYGPPGCSKTLMAKALATESNFNFLAVKGPEVFSKWVGESEKAVREIFRRARAAAPSIIFFDEIDSIVSKRSDQSSETSVTDRVLSQLLIEMDGIESMYDVVIIAATNRPDLIDPALLRPGRIDRILYVGPPDYDARIHIFKSKFSTCKCDIEITPEYLADITDGYSGAECVHLFHEACMSALEEEVDVQKLSSSYFEKAFKRIKPQITPHIIEFYNEFRNASKLEQI